jgi:hypothetical protein
MGEGVPDRLRTTEAQTDDDDDDDVLDLAHCPNERAKPRWSWAVPAV